METVRQPGEAGPELRYGRKGLASGHQTQVASDFLAGRQKKRRDQARRLLRLRTNTRYPAPVATDVRSLICDRELTTPASFAISTAFTANLSCLLLGCFCQPAIA